MSQVQTRKRRKKKVKGLRWVKVHPLLLGNFLLHSLPFPLHCPTTIKCLPIIKICYVVGIVLPNKLINSGNIVMSLLSSQWFGSTRLSVWYDDIGRD